MVFKTNLALPLFFCVLLAQGQPSLGTLAGSKSNHVVIGAFSKLDNAMKFTSEARQSGLEAKFEINPSRQLQYVYILRTGDRVRAFAEARRLRKEKKYWDTWVYYGTLGEMVVSGSSDFITSSGDDGQVLETGEDSNGSLKVALKKNETAVAAEVRAYSMSEEPAGLDIKRMISGAKTEELRDHYEVIEGVKESTASLDKTTKVIIFKDDEEGRQALRSLGYEIKEGDSVSGFFDSRNNILAINATESQAGEPFHEGLRPVVKFLRNKDPKVFESIATQAAAIKNPTNGKTYGELNETDEDALANMMADVSKSYFDNSKELKGEATDLMRKILENLGVEPLDQALNNNHLKVTANNLSVAVWDAAGEEPAGLDLQRMITGAKTEEIKDHYEVIQEVKESASKLDATTKVIVFKDDEKGRQGLRALGYEIEEGKSINGFFDSRNNVLAINATESQAGEPFHEGLRPVVKFLKNKDPEKYQSFATQAAATKHPSQNKTYGELNATDEEALANMMADVAQSYFENSAELKGETTTLMRSILETLGVNPADKALDNTHLETTADNLSIAAWDAAGEEQDGLNLNRVISTSQTEQLINHYEVIQGVKESVLKLDAAAKVIVFKDDAEGRQTLRSLGYEIEGDKSVSSFFDSRNNVMAINATESQTGEPFHEGLKPVVNLVRTKNPEKYESLASQAAAIKHPTQNKTYGELNATEEDALANMMADVSKGYFESSPELRVEATTVMRNMLQTLGIEAVDLALNDDHLKTTAENLAQAVREAKGEAPSGLELNRMISEAQTDQLKNHYEGILDVKGSVSKVDATTKVVVFKDDDEGRQALRALGYDIEGDKPVNGFFDSKNNILAINATETQSEEPFHEGLMPVVKFLRKKDPELFEHFAKQASEIKHPRRGVIYGELNATDEEALASMMTDVAKGYFENSAELKGEATTLMQKILETIGVESADLALSSAHLKVTANNLAIAVRDATGFDADGNRKFRFNLFNTINYKNIIGDVALVNENGRKISSYPGNELVQVKRADASGNIVLACEVLGYRKVIYKLNYDNPFLSDGVERGEDEEAIVSFGLVRLQKGDIAVMYNVYFFRDAAIIRSESRYEINNLLGMMNENPAYKILLHGHTNGNAAGKIITMGDSKNFFSLKETKEGRGSAKKLSEERAKVIRQYLVDQGIELERMEIKAWGGKRALYDKDHSLAQANVRVEVEIVEN